MIAIEVDDPADERLADYVGLTDADLARRGGGVFLAEGVLVIRRLLESRYPVRSLLLAANRVGALADVLDRVDAPVYVASQAVMDAVVGFPIHRGALAAADRVPLPSVAEVVAAARLVGVVEGINDHENMGSLFRNAAAFGVDAVLLSADCCDPLYRRSVRVSLGHVLHVPFTTLGSPNELDGFTTMALTPAVDAEVLGDVAPGGRVAVLVGAEGSGLRPETLAAADRRVRIPMAPGVDSLNVATAAAIAFHHLSAVPST